jgi:hypothetical protein
MCVVKKPKPVSVSKDSTPVPVLRNPYLDGIDPITKARTTGLRSLRIDRGSKPAGAPIKASPLAITRPAAAPDTIEDKVRAGFSKLFFNK